MKTQHKRNLAPSQPASTPTHVAITNQTILDNEFQTHLQKMKSSVQTNSQNQRVQYAEDFQYLQDSKLEKEQEKSRDISTPDSQDDLLWTNDNKGQKLYPSDVLRLNAGSGRGLSKFQIFTPKRKKEPAGLEWNFDTQGNLYSIKGLSNLGNTCYFNSVVQCLSHCTSLLRQCLPVDTLFSNQQIVLPDQKCTLEYFFMNMYTGGTNTIFSPQLLFEKVSQENHQFASHKQGDAHELLLTLQLGLFNKFQQQCFSLQILSTILCLQCGNVSKQREVGVDISAEIPTSLEQLYNQQHLRYTDFLNQVEIIGNCDPNHTFSGWSVKHCLWQFTFIEKLDISQGTGYLCSKCCHSNNQERNAIRQLSIWKLPSVLVIHIKRFKATISQLQKMNDVILSEEEIDLKSFTSQDSAERNQSCIYRLFGIVEHQGLMNGGHYISYVRSAKLSPLGANSDSRGEWFCTNDSSVSRVTFDVVRRAQPYLLFYERQ